MVRYSYAIALGHDQTALTNIEDIITSAPAAQPVPDGSVVRKTLDRKTHVNGAQIQEWLFGALSYADFELLRPYFGEAVTVTTRDGVEAFGTYNAYVNIPQPGTDYTRAAGGVEGLRWQLDILEPTHGRLLNEDATYLLLENGGRIAKG